MIDVIQPNEGRRGGDRVSFHTCILTGLRSSSKLNKRKGIRTQFLFHCPIHYTPWVVFESYYKDISIFRRATRSLYWRWSECWALFPWDAGREIKNNSMDLCFIKTERLFLVEIKTITLLLITFWSYQVLVLATCHNFAV